MYKYASFEKKTLKSENQYIWVNASFKQIRTLIITAAKPRTDEYMYVS